MTDEEVLTLCRKAEGLARPVLGIGPEWTIEWTIRRDDDHPGNWGRCELQPEYRRAWISLWSPPAAHATAASATSSRRSGNPSRAPPCTWAAPEVVSPMPTGDPRWDAARTPAGCPRAVLSHLPIPGGMR